MRIKKTVGTAVVAGGIILAAQTPALAHDRYVGINSAASYFGRIKVTQSHHRIQACDENADGIGVWVEFYTSDGAYRTLDDSNGSADPCGSYTNNSLTVTSFRGWARNGFNTGWQST